MNSGGARPAGDMGPDRWAFVAEAGGYQVAGAGTSQIGPTNTVGRP
jgi:hypothetical protein